MEPEQAGAKSNPEIVYVIPDWYLKHVGKIEAQFAQDMDQLESGVRQDKEELVVLRNRVRELEEETKGSEKRVRDLIEQVSDLQRKLREAQSVPSPNGNGKSKKPSRPEAVESTKDS